MKVGDLVLTARSDFAEYRNRLAIVQEMQEGHPFPADTWVHIKFIDDGSTMFMARYKLDVAPSEAKEDYHE